MASTELSSVGASSPAPAMPTTPPTPPAEREIRYEHAHALTTILSRLNVSLLVSTYQAGKVAMVGLNNNELHLSFHSFERAMGVAVRPDNGQLAVGSQRQVWFLNAVPQIAPRLPPAKRHDGCFVTRTAYYTGEIQIHEMSFGGPQGQELWCVNTLFSCLCTLDGEHSFVPRWRPPFISALAAEDRCHLNGFCLGTDGMPAYVTVIGQTDTPQGWRTNKVSGGCLIHVPSNQTVLQGLSMPHSPRLDSQNRLWVLDSGRGRLLAVDPTSGKSAVACELPGYVRGMAIYAGHAFIGLSRIRETNVFGGLPIAAEPEELKCGIGIVELNTGRLIAHLEFKSGVEEIFAVEVLPGLRCPAISGPHPELDGSQAIWNVPAPDESTARSAATAQPATPPFRTGAAVTASTSR